MVMQMRMRIHLEHIYAAARRDDEIHRAHMAHGECLLGSLDDIGNFSLFLLAEIGWHSMIIVAGYFI